MRKMSITALRAKLNKAELGPGHKMLRFEEAVDQVALPADEVFDRALLLMARANRCRLRSN
ncbi:hypothetical protein [Bradyrhizobium sp. 151]|uniref:hypothetical protein n=1 Tax=Bradyrhizobium sp. 151 TaxID=2782626 RepID=UPI001FF86FDF|nr:hypothetical protein [Bradyrhizobium sp. 151]MCK1656612.1 hypothetical protein [Bradyrhizobium sp. 151]